MSTTQNLAFLSELDITHELDVPLGPLTWYGIGGSAQAVAHPQSIEQLSQLVARAYEAKVPLYVLGAGANLLVADEGVKGVVVRLDAPCWSQVEMEGDLLRVGAGMDLPKLVLQTAKMGLAGLEVLAGIPATVGGAVRMNAGGAFGEIGKRVHSVRLMDERGEVYERTRDDLIFSYRRCNIAALLILDVCFSLDKADADELTRRVKEVFFYKKTTQPLGADSAGCAFKNPSSDGLPADVPPAAGALIERAGLKGYSVGGAKVSDKHANFIVVDKSTCKSADVLAVMTHVQQTVFEKFGVQLEREVVVWR